TEEGAWAIASAGRATRSAWVPRPVASWADMATTWSPTAKPVTASPTAVTVPARSQPRIMGGPLGVRSAWRPARVWRSTGLTATAALRTRTPSGPGPSGSGTSRTVRTSGPPYVG